jgi:hypothetical protein
MSALRPNLRRWQSRREHDGRRKRASRMPVCRAPPHRHDLEEMFTIPHGEIGLTFRGEVRRAAGSTVNIRANAPTSSAARRTGRRACSRPGRRSFFMLVGDPVDSPIAPPPVQGKDEQAERVRRAKALAAKYRTELPVSGTLFRGRVTRSRQCRTCEAQCPGIAMVRAQTGAVGAPKRPTLTHN